VIDAPLGVGMASAYMVVVVVVTAAGTVTVVDSF